MKKYKPEREHIPGSGKYKRNRFKPYIIERRFTGEIPDWVGDLFFDYYDKEWNEHSRFARKVHRDHELKKLQTPLVIGTHVFPNHHEYRAVDLD